MTSQTRHISFTQALTNIFAAARRFNWQRNLWAALCMALFETAFLFIAFNGNFQEEHCSLVWNIRPIEENGMLGFLELINLFGSSLLVWFGVFCLFNLLFLFRKHIRRLLLRAAFSLLLGIGVGFCALAYTMNWVYFTQSGHQFLNRELLAFGISNFGHLAWHFLQFSPSLVLLATGVTCGVFVMFWLLFVFLARPASSRIPRFVVLGVLVVAAGYNIFFHNVLRKPWQRQDPAIVTMVNPAKKRTYRKLELVNRYGLVPKSNTRDYSTIQRDTPVIMILLESLRHDILLMEPSPIPHLRALASQSLLFDYAYAVSPHSNYSDISFWYAQFPLRSQQGYQYTKASPHRGTSIFEVFDALGYHTAYISSQNESWGGMGEWLEGYGIDYYFHAPDAKEKTYLDSKDSGFSRLAKQLGLSGKLPDSVTLSTARQWIKERQSQQFFLGINLQNTHYSYYLPEDAEMPFQPTEDFEGMFGSWPEEELVPIRNRYLNALFHVDALLAEFIEYLKQEQIWDNCLFLVVGDNGEAFYEHGHVNHARFMHDEVVRTFTMMKPPQPYQPEVISTPVSHIDVVSGALDWLDIPQPYSFQGISPFQEPRESIYMVSDILEHQDGILEWPWKLLFDYSRQQTELYNIEEDPGEKENVAEQHSAVSDQLMGKITEWRNAQLSYYEVPEIYSLYYPPQFK